jgi:peptidoglycan/LPS O-acetylase OafA/YrhL
VAFPRFRITIGRLMVAIVLIGSMLATIQNIWFGVLWIFLWGPLCGIWLFRRKGAWMILGGGAGGVTATLLQILISYLDQQPATADDFIQATLVVPALSGLLGTGCGICAWGLMRATSSSPGTARRVVLPEEPGPIDVAKWRELNHGSGQTQKP